MVVLGTICSLVRLQQREARAEARRLVRVRA